MGEVKIIDYATGCFEKIVFSPSISMTECYR